MRPHFFLIISALFFAGCARQGVIVQKESRPSPFYHSLGIEGSYAFMLRDSAGTLHRQMVTPDVYERYAEGDYFNDLQPGATRTDAIDSKVMKTALRPAHDATRFAKMQKTTLARRIATARKFVPSRYAGAKAAANKKRVAKRTRKRTKSRTVVQIAQIVAQPLPPAQPVLPEQASTQAAPEMSVVSVARCR